MPDFATFTNGSSLSNMQLRGVKFETNMNL